MKGILFFVIHLLLILITGCGELEKVKYDHNLKIDLLSEAWPGWAIAYSGYREGQDPRVKKYPSQKEVKEDLLILERNWRLIRTYGADQHTSDILEIIRREKLNLKVLMGIWLDGEPDYAEDNKSQIKYGIELANKFKDIVIAINVGNETQPEWSDHKISTKKLITYIDTVKSEVSVPVTTADTWDYWLDTVKSRDLIDAVDFLAVHVYPIWGKLDIDNGLSSTIEIFQKLKSTNPYKKIIISEAGWATYTEGELHVPQAGDEKKQKRYFQELMQWSQSNKITVFWFEAFDEPWKGNGTEGHWGLFTEGRKAKLAMHDLYPELVISEPTSPSYE